MAKRPGSPDRRGMGAQSDFISETFVPGETYKAEQLARARILIASGISPQQVATMLSVPIECISAPDESSGVSDHLCP